MLSFWTNYLLGIYFLTIFFWCCWLKWEASQKPHGREIWRKYKHYSGQMAQRVSVLRQPSHMAKLAQNQNQSHKTIGMAGEGVRAAGIRMTILSHWELGQPDGAEGARQEFHRRKVGFAPFYLSRITSLPAMPPVGLLSRNSLFASLCLWLCWSFCLELLPPLLPSCPV